MNRLFLLLALLSLAMLSSAPDSVSIRAQEMISATGNVSEAYAAEAGEGLQSSHVELSFPAEGGDVNGEWSVVFNVDFGPNQAGETFCIFTLTITGQLQGTYDGGAALQGTTTLTGSPSNVTGCQDANLGGGEDIGEWSATFAGQQVSLLVDSSEFAFEFTAKVSANGDVPPADEPLAETPAAGEPVSDAFIDIVVGNAGLDSLGPRIDKLTDCAEPEIVGGQAIAPGVGDCPGQMPGYTAAERFKQEFDNTILDFSLNEKEMSKRLYTAIFLAGMEGPGGQPLFPSVIAAMPVVKKLADLSNVQPAQQEDALRVVARFVELLAARDADVWEQRFP